MNINKKLDRVKQWAGEKMGAEAKTNVSEEFRALEREMNLRQEGMERLQRSMASYVKSLSKRNEAEDKEKILPVAYLGQTMISHGEDFEPDSEFGNCLIGMGRANERIARLQESYMSHATATWLESLDRSNAQMKEYQNSRKKLETRRLAYDASLSKMQKAKKEDYRMEDELRNQKVKYEETSEDVLRRMQDIKEAEVDSVTDLGAFLDAELEYYDRCRDELIRLKKEWPAGPTPSSNNRDRRPNRSRSNTAHSYSERYADPEPEPEIPRPSIRGTRLVSSRLDTRREYPDALPSPVSPSRPQYGRSHTFEGPTSIYARADTPTSMSSRKASVPDNLGALRGNLRPTNRINTTHGHGNGQSDVFGDPSDESTVNSASPDHSYRDRSISPATSHGSGSVASRSASYSALPAAGTRKGPPPPPPSRTKKPPPPPPMKRAEFSGQSISRY